MNEYNGKWKNILNEPREKKWEMKYNNIVLGTIYHKPQNGKFSLYVSSPKVYKEFHEISKTHQFDSLSEAQSAFDNFIKEKVAPWGSAAFDYSQKVVV